MPKVSAKVLTEKAVQAAKAPPGKRLELWDARVPGLCLRVTDKGSKTWVVRYRTPDGRQPRFSLGSAGDLPGDLSLVDARERASQVRRLARDGGDPAAEKRKANAEAKSVSIRTVDDLAELYFAKSETGKYKATKRGKKPETVAGERRLWNFRLKPSLGKRPVDAVAKSELRDLLEQIAEEVPIQSNRARALLRSMFNFAIHEERLAANPVTGIPAFGDETARDRVLTDEEIKAVWLALCDPAGLSVGEGKAKRALQISLLVRIALRLSLLTLQRRTEIAGMRRDELRMNECTWTIGKERTKNGKAHLVPLPPEALSLVRQAMDLQDPENPSPFVFPSPWAKLERQSIDGGALSHALSDLYSSLKIEDANLHDLRRTGASAMASERLLVPPIVISRVLNHTVDGGGGAAVTARHYNVHAYATEKRTALAGWEDLLLEIVGVRKRPDGGARPEEASHD